METIEEQGLREKEAAERIIGATNLFPGIESFHVELGEDHSGDPSMWIVFRVRSETPVDSDWIRAYSDYSNTLSLKLLHSGLTRFPYTRLESTN